MSVSVTHRGAREAGGAIVGARAAAGHAAGGAVPAHAGKVLCGSVTQRQQTWRSPPTSPYWPLTVEHWQFNHEIA
jgi:hypothetical protein